MCGIFGSTNRHVYEELYSCNQQRGSFSYGGLYIKDNSATVTRSKRFESPPYGCDWYLGHTRAPTSIGEFDPFKAHPFQSELFISFHNGIIQNAQVLGKQIDYQVTIDSEIIPILAAREVSKVGDEVSGICRALEALDGIYGLALYSTKTNSIYLARCASTLYASAWGAFSSQKPAKDAYNLLREGTLYRISANSLEEVGNFQYNSPYLVL